MRHYSTFQISDYAAQQNKGWRVRWGPQELNMTLLVDQSSDDALLWRLVYSPTGEDPDIRLERDNQFAPAEVAPGIVRKMNTKTRLIDPSQPLPKILMQCYRDHVSQVPAPRRKNETPYIDRAIAEGIEKRFYETMICPYESSHVILGVDRSGVELANRLGVHLDGRISVNHYYPNTYQDDSDVEAEIIGGSIDTSRPVLIIDDMLSSGRTAQAILSLFEDEYPEVRVRFVALYDIVASREVPEVEASVETYQKVSNHYWTYGRGADLITPESRLYPDVMGADKAFGWETEDDINDLLNFFHQ